MPSEFNLFDIDLPAFLMNVPFSLSADIPNNIWMHELDASQRCIERDKSITQFFDLYKAISQTAIVYLLPSTAGLQDQTYVSNLAVVLPHLPRPTAVVSRFRSPLRVGEAAIGQAFFEMMNFAVEVPPKRMSGGGLKERPDGEANQQNEVDIFFEGEADLKYLVDNVYIGAHGLRSSRAAHQWFSGTYGMEVIPFHMKYERLYHLDCCVMPLSPQRAAICTEAADKPTIAEIEKHVEILNVPMEAAIHGATNSLLLQEKILYSSNINSLSSSDIYYSGEKCKIIEIEKLADTLGIEAIMFNLSEFDKSGADLSCMIMRLNYNDYTNRGTSEISRHTP